MRQTVQNVGLLVIVLSLSAVFLLEFGGPQSRGCSSGGASGYAAKVYSDSISLGELKASYIMANGPRYSTETARQMKLKELVLGGLIERELLAREARALGFNVTQDEVMAKLATDGLIYTTAPVGAPSSIPNGPQPVSFEDKDGMFSAENARRFIQNRLGRSVEEFAKAQIEETLAQRMREVIASSVVVSPNEVWDAFVREKDKVEIKYVKYDLAFYRDRIQLTEADIQSYLASHAKDIDAEYEKEKHRYTGLEKQVRARHILVKAASDADQATRDAAKKKAEGLRQRAVKGEDFAKLARENSEDEGSAPSGGDLGYNVKGKMVTQFDDAQFALKKGDISEVVETRFGYHVIKLEGIREGNVPLDEAKREIAERQALNDRASTMAKQAAEAGLAELAQGGTPDALNTRLEAEKKAANDAPLAPVVKDSRPFGRGESPVPGVDSPELTAAAFEATMESPLAKAPIKAGESFVIFKLSSREVATKEAFAGAEQERLTDALLRRKRQEVLDDFVRGLRKKADNEGAIVINPEAVEYSVREETASL